MGDLAARGLLRERDGDPLGARWTGDRHDNRGPVLDTALREIAVGVEHHHPVTVVLNPRSDVTVSREPIGDRRHVGRHPASSPQR